MLNHKSQITNHKQIPNPKLQNSKQKSFGHCNFGNWLLFGIWCLVIGILAGCATITEMAKGVAGVSTKILEEARKEAIIKQINYDYNTCYNKVKEGLIARGSYIYAESARKHMLAFYISEEDTTPVGIFFKELDANNTQVEVSSPSKSAKEFIAKRVDVILGELPDTQAQANAEKELVNK